VGHPADETTAAATMLEADICVYGGTSGGVVAAVQAARMGRRVVLLEPGRHLGGMTSVGLSAVESYPHDGNRDRGSSARAARRSADDP
jgi:choline dehydrogenase-like flavoprotein